MMQWLDECVSETPEKSTAHSIFCFGGHDFGGSRLNVKIHRLYVNQRLAQSTEEAIFVRFWLLCWCEIRRKKKNHPLERD